MADDSVKTDIEVWYTNPDTGGMFGFGYPLPEAIAEQVRAGKLWPCDPDGHQLPPPTQEADLTGGGTDPIEEAVLHPCADCGEVAMRGLDGEYLELCRRCAAKGMAATLEAAKAAPATKPAKVK